MIRADNTADRVDRATVYSRGNSMELPRFSFERDQVRVFNHNSTIEYFENKLEKKSARRIRNVRIHVFVRIV